MKTIKVKNFNDVPANFTGIVEYFDGTKGWYLNGKPHREEGPCTTCKDCLKGNFVLCTKPGPAIESPGRYKEWYLNGMCHREDGPAIEFSNGSKYWYLNGKYHREGGPCTACKDCLEGNFVLCTKPGPAVERVDGYKAWYLNDKLHRENGPAIEHSDGYKAWFLNGELHREDGPAVEDPDEYKEWRLNGKEVDKKTVELYFMLKYKKYTNF